MAKGWEGVPPLNKIPEGLATGKGIIYVS